MPLALARRLTGKLVLLGHVVGTHRHPGQRLCTNTGARGPRLRRAVGPALFLSAISSGSAVSQQGSCKRTPSAHSPCTWAKALASRAAAPLTLSLVAAVAALASRGGGLAGGGGALAKHAGHRLPAQLLHQLGVVHCKAGGKAQVSWGLW